jgi:hypothetical protein
MILGLETNEIEPNLITSSPLSGSRSWLPYLVFHPALSLTFAIFAPPFVWGRAGSGPQNGPHPAVIIHQRTVIRSNESQLAESIYVPTAPIIASKTGETQDLLD